MNKITQHARRIAKPERAKQVGKSCPIALEAAQYILNVSWMAIGFRKAADRFWDRDLTNCEKVTSKTFRYRSVLAAPVKNTRAATLAHMQAVHTQEIALGRHGFERQWGDVYVPRLQESVRMYEWAAEVRLSSAMVTLLNDHICARMRYDTYHAQYMKSHFEHIEREPSLPFDKDLKETALRYDAWLVEFECLDKLPITRYRCMNMHDAVSEALAIGIQRQRLGEIMFRSSELVPRFQSLTRQDVVKYDARVTLLHNCMLVADTQSL
jgi:hypothetical protein